MLIAALDRLVTVVVFIVLRSLRKSTFQDYSTWRRSISILRLSTLFLSISLLFLMFSPQKYGDYFPLTIPQTGSF